MQLNREYYYCEINIPGVILDISIWETPEERDAYASELEDHYNVIYNGKKIETKAGINRGNCVSSFIGKWRIMRVESKDDQSATESEMPEGIQQNISSLKTRR